MEALRPEGNKKERDCSRGFIVFRLDTEKVWRRHFLSKAIAQNDPIQQICNQIIIKGCLLFQSGQCVAECPFFGDRFGEEVCKLFQKAMPYFDFLTAFISSPSVPRIVVFIALFASIPFWEASLQRNV